MRIFNIIDSLELNGGSTMFLEMTSAMQKYWTNDSIRPLIVSKSGEMGRKSLVDEGFAPSYGVHPEVYSYDDFQKVVDRTRNTIVFHHVLGHTKAMKFHPSCRYIVINHTLTNMRRLPMFRAHQIVSVCRFFDRKLYSATRVPSLVILNRVEDYYKKFRKEPGGPFVIGRCQRIVPSKYRKVVFDQIDFPNGYKHLIVGPVSENSRMVSESDEVVGAVFDRDTKIKHISSFDVYLHHSGVSEGASMAMLEALSCGVPVLVDDIPGGARDIIIDGKNGFFFRDQDHLRTILKRLQDPAKLKAIKKSVRKDFEQRLHIKKSLRGYRRLMQ